MAAPEGPARFECPADFCPCPLSPAPAFSRETLQSPSKQLWLIQAPATFSPESLDGHAMPLLGSKTLKVAQPDGTRKVYSVQATLGDLDSAHLLIPAGRQHHLACAPSFSGVLSVCERHGDSSANRLLFPVAARPAPQIPDGLRQRFLPFGGLPFSQAAEAPPGKKRKKKRRELHTVGYLGAPEEPLSPEHKPWPGGASVGPAGEAGGFREGGRSRRHKQEEALPPALGAAPQLLPEQGSHSSQGSLFSGGVTEPSRKKRKRQLLLKEEAEELPLEPSALPQQPAPEEPCFRESPLADWAAEGSSPGAEGPAHCKPRKKKKKKRRQEEEEEEASTTVASMDAASVRQEAERGQWDSGGLAESLCGGRHKKRKKEKVVEEEQPLPWEQGVEAEVLGPSPVLQDAGGWAEPGLPSEERKHKKKKKKKHKREAAEEESLA